MTTPAVNVFATKNTTKNFSRSELLQWINQCLQSKFLKVEEMCTGAAYCLLMDMMFPGTVQVKRIKFNANQEHEYVQNFKLLQGAFIKVQVNMTIPIEKLVKGRYQDNYEFMAFFKLFFDANYNGADYDPIAARKGVALGKGDVPGKQQKPPLAKAQPKRGDKPLSSYRGTGDVKPAHPKSVPSHRASKISIPQAVKSISNSTNALNLEPLDNNTGDETIKKLMAEAEKCNALKKERNAYYGKLRAVEIFLDDIRIESRNVSVKEVAGEIRRILFAPNDEFDCEMSD